MTALPQLVAAFHSLVGLAAVFVAAAAFYSPSSFGIGVEGSIKTASWTHKARPCFATIYASVPLARHLASGWSLRTSRPIATRSFTAPCAPRNGSRSKSRDAIRLRICWI